MDFDLTDEQRLIRDTAREFTDKEIVEQASENARNHHFDLELVKKIADQGYLGAIVPREYGGAGLGYTATAWWSRRSAVAAARCAPSSPCRPRSSAARSSNGAPRSRSSTTCPSCARASGWDASA